jgi:uncharacterized membrane protein
MASDSAQAAETISQHDAESPDEQDDTPAQPEAEEAAEEPAEPIDSGNTPYFIGAVIAVLVFLGVAFYCKTNGNKPY